MPAPFASWSPGRERACDYDCYHVSKRFFLKKEAETFARLSPASRRQPYKSFLILLLKKNRFLTGVTINAVYYKSKLRPRVWP